MTSDEIEKSQNRVDQVALARAMRDYVPPGYKDLTTIRDELGAVELRDRLFRGELQAFFLSPNGDITKCGKKLWSSDHGEIAMRSGRLRDERILIADVETSRGELSQGTPDDVYVSPFIKLMLEASREFDLGSAAGMRKNKEELVEWFRGKRLPDGTPISKYMATSMATLCRRPDAMRGGNKR